MHALNQSCRRPPFLAADPSLELTLVGSQETLEAGFEAP